jgi:hypothetical protein
MNKDAARALAHELISRGVKPDVAAGAIAGIMGESGGNLDPTAFNANDPGGGSGGIGQWNRDRLVGANGLLAFAQANGVQGINTSVPTDSKKVPLGIQIKYLGHELDTRYSGVLKGLQVLNNGNEGLELWVNNYEAPLDKAGAIAQRHQYVAPVAALIGGKDPGPIALGSGGATGAGGGANQPPAAAPVSPQATLGTMLGQAFAGLGNDLGSQSGGMRFSDPVDEPAIRAPAAFADFAPSHEAVPAFIAQGAGSSPIAQQLGSLAATPSDTPLVNANMAPSITAGAPGMTAMLGAIGTQGRPGGPPNLMNPYAPTMRLA